MFNQGSVSLSSISLNLTWITKVGQLQNGVIGACHAPDALAEYNN